MFLSYFFKSKFSFYGSFNNPIYVYSFRHIQHIDYIRILKALANPCIIHTLDNPIIIPQKTIQ